MGTGHSGRGMNLTTHFRIVPRSRMVEIYLHSPIRPHGVVLDQLSIGATLLLRPNDLLNALFSKTAQN
jgi:hypothetical protein